MKTTRRITRAITRLPLCIVHSAFCIAFAVSAAAEDYILSTPLPQASWTEMGPCPSVGCIVFPIEAKSCGAWGGNYSCTSSFVRVESDNLYSAIFQWVDGTYIKSVKINFKIENGLLYAKGVSAGYVSKSGSTPYPYDFNNKSYTTQTYATTQSGSGYGIKELTFHVLLNGVVVSSNQSEIGTPDPGYGVVNLASGAAHPVSCPTVWTNAPGDTAATCTGWKLYDENGEVVSNGMGNAFTYLHPASGGFRRLEWQWAMEYKVTATAGEGGVATPAEQWVADGSIATITAITNATFAFGKWTNDVPDSVRYDNPVSFTVFGPCKATAVFTMPGTVPPYAYRLIANGGDYRNASKWEDERVPPGDAANDDIFVAEGAGGNMDHTQPFHSLTFEKGAKTFTVWSYSNCKVGAGGVTSPHADGPGVYGYTHVYLLCSQRWLFNGTGSFQSYGGYTLPEDAVWTLCGPNSLSITRPAPATGTPVEWTALGRMRSNMSFNFSAYNLVYLPTNGLYWTNNDLDGGHVKTNALGVPNISLSIAHADAPDIPVPPIDWDFTNPKGAWQFGSGNTGGTLLLTDSSYGGRMRFGAWNGRINDAVVKIDFRAGKNLFNAYRAPRMVLANPGTLDASDRPRVWWKRGMLEIGDDNAFGVSNRLSLLIGHAGIAQDTYGDGWGGIAAGIVAAPGVTVASDICVSNANVYYTLGRQVWLGAMDAGDPAVFTGNVENNDAMLSKSLMWARCPSQIRLFSGRGAEAQFTGSFTGSALLPMEVHGWGATRLSGDNSGLKAGVSVRSGTLKVAADNALGYHPVALGGTVPDAIDVEYYSSTNLTFKAGSPLIVDGNEVRPGERVVNMTRVFKLAADGSSFAADPDVSATAYGLRANIVKGEEFAGTAFHCVHAFNNVCAFVEEPPEPSVALLAEGPRVITNDVAVTDNLSTGSSTIGGCTADTSVFSGKITLARGVTFHAAPGGIVRLTGSITDAGENLHPFAFSGTGTVELPSGTDMNGRVVSFPDLTDEALDATGQTSCTLVSAPGGLNLADIAQPSLSKWQLRVKPDRIRASKVVGTKIMIQ